MAQARPVLAAPPVPSRDAVVLRHCDVEYEQSTFVSGHSGTGMALPLQESLVRLGDRVKSGQVLGRLVDRELQTQLAVLRAQAESDIEIRLAESQRSELVHKLKRTERLRDNSRGYASEEEYDSMRIQVETARLAIEDAKHKRKLAHMKCLELEAQIKNREIVAPHDGIIVEVFKKTGETVVAGQPVFQIVEADRLRVTAYSNLSDYTRIRPGQRIEIAPERDTLDAKVLARTFEGKVLFVDKRIDARSQTCRVVAEVDNQDLTLAAGLEARMTIYTATPNSQTSSRPIPAPRSATPRTEPDPGQKVSSR
jgi:RND family efflux transporter MFP subunit